MAITTLAGAAAGTKAGYSFFKQNLPTYTPVNGMGSSWFASTTPSAGTSSAGAGGAALSNTSAQVTGTIPFYDPAGGSNSYLSRITQSVLNGGFISHMLCDRLWDSAQNSSAANYSVTSTGAQTINSATWPARDSAGATNGQDVYIGLEVITTLGSGGAVSASISYTNSAGVSGKTGTLIVPIQAAAQNGSLYIFALQAGDVGVQSVQSVTLASSLVSGAIGLVAFRMLCLPNEPAVGGAFPVTDALTSGFPRLYNGTVPFFVTSFSNNNTNLNGNLFGSIAFTQG